MKNYNVIGLMSGTSLDGVDIAHCNIFEQNNKWNFKLIKAETIPYDNSWKELLQNIEQTDAITLARVNVNFGKYLGSLTKKFINKNNIAVDFISSHGHTIFHQPDKGLTLQIGDGASISSICNKTVVCDFRTLDVANGGQGAPLVPIGDKLLFSDYEYCLNLGGFANISFDCIDKNERLAFDICPVNIVINHFCKSLCKDFDDKGEIAKSGTINEALLKELNSLSYYKKAHPKSLGKEWVLEHIFPLLDKHNISVNDILRTVYEHIAIQISSVLKDNHNHKVLVTGGGAYNNFLIERIKDLTKANIVIPDNNIVEYKEALIFAFLGVLRMENKINCLKSVTGAKKDSICGAVYFSD